MGTRRPAFIARIPGHPAGRPAGDMIQKDRTGGDQFETSAAADQQMKLVVGHLIRIDERPWRSP